MAAFTVYIANLARVPDAEIQVMSTSLAAYFTRVVAGTSSSFNGIRVVSHNRGLAITRFDLLCYIVPDFAHGKVRLFNSHYHNSRGNAGNTSLFPESTPVRAASEVYTSVINSLAVNKGLAYANLIFHELMHNKTGLGNALHSLGGEGLAAESVGEDSVLTQANCSFLAGSLNNEMQQYIAHF